MAPKKNMVLLIIPSSNVVPILLRGTHGQNIPPLRIPPTREAMNNVVEAEPLMSLSAPSPPRMKHHRDAMPTKCCLGITMIVKAPLCFEDATVLSSMLNDIKFFTRSWLNSLLNSASRTVQETWYSKAGSLGRVNFCQQESGRFGVSDFLMEYADPHLRGVLVCWHVVGRRGLSDFTAIVRRCSRHKGDPQLRGSEEAELFLNKSLSGSKYAANKATYLSWVKFFKED